MSESPDASEVSSEPKHSPKRPFDRLISIVATSAFANFVTTGALILAAVSFVIAHGLQQRLNAEQLALQRQIAANEVWTNYIEWSFNNAELTLGGLEVKSDGTASSEKYIWFMERLLSASEEILNAYPDDVQWIETFVYEYQIHEDYFLSDYFLARKTQNGVELLSFFCTYDPPVRAAIQRAFSGRPDQAARVQRAVRECNQDLQERGQPNA